MIGAYRNVNPARHLPALATLGNIAAGVAACALAVTQRPDLGGLMILAAVLMDSLDGALARSLDATSDFGAELDSLADVVSFGVAPAVLVGSLLPIGARQIGWALVTLYPLCAAWRLARFNVSHNGSEEGHEDFAGLPTTGAGAAAATAVLVYARLGEAGVAVAPMVLPCVLLILGGLMISRIPYRHVGSLISRMKPGAAFASAAGLLAASVLWHEYVFAALMWGYTISGVLATARERIRAVRHA